MIPILDLKVILNSKCRILSAQKIPQGHVRPSEKAKILNFKIISSSLRLTYVEDKVFDHLYDVF